MRIQDSFGYIISINAKLIKRQLEGKIKKYDITSAQWSVLKLLSVENNLTQVEIAYKLKADIVTIGLIIDRLVKKNMLQKVQDEKDRRAYKISIADHVRDIVGIIEEEAVKCNEVALDNFTDKEVETLFFLLNKVLHNLSKEN